MVSIKDVASSAGVAISTVSKVLNHYPNISEETKLKVNAAIEELHYIPNSIAAALSSKQACRVALLMNLIEKTQVIDEISMQYLFGALHTGKELKLDIVTLFFSMIEEKTPRELIAYLESQSITGIVIYGMQRDNKAIQELIASKRFHIVVVDVPIVNSLTSSVGINHKAAQYEVAEKTIQENNCHRILYLAGKKNSYPAEARLEGMKELAKKEDLDLFVVEGEFSELKARELTFQYGADYDAIVCATDLMAIGAMKALTEMDIFRPVCGFDGLMLMGYVGKQMNTVSQEFNNVSECAVRELNRIMNGEKGRKVELPYQISRLDYLDIIC